MMLLTMAAPAESFNRVIGSLFDTVKEVALQVASDLQGPSMLILGAAFGIAFVKLLMEAMFEDGLVGALADGIGLVIASALAMAYIQNQAAIHTAVWNAADAVVSTIAPSSGSGEEMFVSLWQSMWSTIKKVWNLATTMLHPPGTEAAWYNLIGKAMDAVASIGLMFQSIFVAGVATLLLLIYFGIIFVQFLVPLFRIGITLALGPVAIAFAPIWQSWWKNVVGQVASGIAYFAGVAFMFTVTDKVVSKIVATITVFMRELSGGRIDTTNATSAAQLVALLSLLMICAAIALIGLATGKVLDVAASIFDGAGGMMTAVMGGKKPGGAPNSGGGADGGASRGGSDQAVGGGGGGVGGGGGGGGTVAGEVGTKVGSAAATLATGGAGGVAAKLGTMAAKAGGAVKAGGKAVASGAKKVSGAYRTGGYIGAAKTAGGMAARGAWAATKTAGGIAGRVALAHGKMGLKAAKWAAPNFAKSIVGNRR